MTTTAAPGFDQVRNYLKSERWLGEVPGFSRLYSYVAKIGAEGNPNHPFWRLVRRPKDMTELAPAANLVWYLNSGGRRNYVIAGRPDEDDRTTANPDFLLRDERSGQKVALEVTSVFRQRDISGVTPFRRTIVGVLQMVLPIYLSQPGRTQSGRLFRVHVGDVAIRQRGLHMFDAVEQMVDRILDATETIPEGGKITIDAPFEVDLVNDSRVPVLGERDRFVVSERQDPAEQAALAATVEKLDYSDDDGASGFPDAHWFERWRREWSIDPDMLSRFEGALDEANRKLSGFSFPAAVRALLVTLRFELMEFIPEDVLYVERLRELPSERWPNVDKLYVQYKGVDTIPWTVSRVW